MFIRFLSYWLKFLNVVEIFGIFSYSMVTDLLESLAILFIVLLFCAILPPKLLKDVFVVRSTFIVLCLLGLLMVFLNYYASADESFAYIAIWSLSILLATGFVSAFLIRLQLAVSAARWLAENMTIFLYIFIPVTGLGFILLVVRNL